MAENNDSLLEARINDLICIAQKSYRSGFLGFLDEGGETRAKKIVNGSGMGDCALFWGGFESAERKMLGVFNSPDEVFTESFPIAALTFRYKAEYKLSHRDFLGALMSLGIKREAVGDILIENGRCVIFVKEEIADYIAGQIETVGRVGVKIFEGAQEPLPDGADFENISGTVASERLDCIVAALIGTNREKAVLLIKSGAVKTAGIECTDTSKKLTENTTVSVKGFGKFIVDRLGPVTKKGRLSFKGRKYK